MSDQAGGDRHEWLIQRECTGGRWALLDKNTQSLFGLTSLEPG